MTDYDGIIFACRNVSAEFFAVSRFKIFFAATRIFAAGYQNMLEVKEKWDKRYPNAMKSWEVNWDAILPMFKFSPEVRKVIYTTNAIESLNSAYRRLNRQRSIFPSDTSLLKALYLATFEATKKWTLPLKNWGKVYGELSIMYDGRI